MHSPVPAPETDVVRLLADLVGVDTTNPGGDEPVGLAVLARRFEERGVPVTVDAYRPGNANLVATCRVGSGEGPTVLLNSHIDVVPAGEDWASDPFTARVEGGRVYGRGAADAKGSLAAMAVALLGLLDDPTLSGTVLFTAVGDEEVGSTGARALVQHVTADACIVGEPTDLRLMTAHKGSVRPVVEIRGVAAHAATPQAGANAIVGSGDLLDRLAELGARLAERGHPLVGAPTLTPVLVSGGEAPNAVPERVRITIDRRLVPGETADAAVAEIEEVLSAFSAANAPLVATVADRAPSTGGPSETPQDHPFVVTAQAAMRAVGEDPELTGLVVNCDMTTFRAAGIPTLVLGPGTLAVMHTRDEFVETEQLDRAVVAYGSVLRALLTPSTSDPVGSLTGPAVPLLPLPPDHSREDRTMPRTFPEAEYTARLDRFRSTLAERGVDVAVVTAPENVCYLVGHETAGYYTYQCLIVPADGEPVLLTRETETVNGLDTTYLEHVVGYPDVDDPIARTADLVASVAPGARSVGLEARSWFLPPELFEQLAAAFGDARIVRVDDDVAQLRLVKSAAEIERIRVAAAITNAGMRAGALAAVPGVRERDVAATAFAEMIRRGSEYVGMEPFVASGPRAGNIHASWSDRVIREGEGVLLEMAASSGRYHAPLMYSVATGALQGDSARMAEACQAARDATVAMVRPGSTPAQAHLECRRVIDEHGLIHTYRKRSGYSVGIAFAPDWGEGHILSLKETEHRVFEPGMVVHVVPTLRLAGVAGQGFSATVLVTEDGNEVLTSCDVVDPGAAA